MYIGILHYIANTTDKSMEMDKKKYCKKERLRRRNRIPERRELGRRTGWVISSVPEEMNIAYKNQNSSSIQTLLGFYTIQALYQHLSQMSFHALQLQVIIATL